MWEEEIKSLKTLIFAYLIFISFAIAGFLFGKFQGLQLMEDWQFWGVMVASNLSSCLYAGLAIHFRKGIFLAKYILFGVMAIVITFGMYWIGSLWIFLGYYLLLAMSGFFYGWRIPLFTGILSLICFFFLIYLTGIFTLSEYIIWIVYFCPLIGVVTFINQKNLFFINRLIESKERLKEAKKDLEEAKAVLEIKVEARTKELRELAESLDVKVKERTKELQEKINELERFSRLAVGRELKMITLKEEIKKLTEELEKHKKI